MAQEVLDLIKQLIGVEDFSDVYSKSNKKRTERIEERKRKSAQIVNILKLLISFMIISIFLNLFLGCN